MMLKQEQADICYTCPDYAELIVGYVLPQKKQSPKSGCLKIAVTEILADN